VVRKVAETTSVTIIVPLACVCGDFVDSHSQRRMWSDGSVREPIKTTHGGICWGWCDQTCPEFRPVPMERTSSAWVAVLGKANQLRMPEHFASDLYRDWQRLTADDAPRVFIWSPYQNGTDLLYGPDVLCWLNAAVARTREDRHWFVWDELTLQPDHIHDIYRRFGEARALERQHLIPAAPPPD
jgi:hypothetical protein